MIQFEINSKKVGVENQVYIIAEAGVNHNGNIKQALQLIESAAEVGADAVKFQTFKGGDVTLKETKMAKYQINNLGLYKTQLEMLKELSLAYKYYPILFKKAKEKQITLLSTPSGGFKAVDVLEKFSITAYKIGSGDITNLPLLSYVALKQKPIILSTGISTISEINEALQIILKSKNNNIGILHCTSSYPCPLKNVNLNVITSLLKKYAYPVGYSDHTQGIDVAIYACLLGAKIIEKHITLDKDLPGPDQKNSLEPNEFKLMVKGIREIEKLSYKERKNRIKKIPELILGQKQKRPTKEELLITKAIRKSIVWNRNLKKNHRILNIDLDIKRPGSGIHPRHYWSIIGKTTIKKIKKDSIVKPSDFI